MRKSGCFINRVSAASSVELGILAGLIAVTVIGSVSLTGTNLKNLFTESANSIPQLETIYKPWQSVGIAYDHSDWAPSITNQSADFPQSRTYSIDYERLVKPVDGPSYLETRTETGTEDRLVTVQLGPWLNDGGLVNCGPYSPDANSVTYGEEFTQTATCDQNQIRHDRYYADSTLLKNLQRTQTITATDTRNATGTLETWSSIANSYTSWQTTRNHSYGSYSPSIGSQTYNFTQTRPYKSDQTRTVYEREQNDQTSEIRVVQSYPAYRTVNRSLYRSVYYSAPIYSCPSSHPNLSVHYGNTCYDEAFYPHERGYESCPSSYDISPQGRCTNYVAASKSCPSGYSMISGNCYDY